MPKKKNVPKYLRGLSAVETSDRLDYLKNSIKLLRKTAKGFEASDGYDLRHPEKIHSSKLAKILRWAPYVREVTARPHIAFRPRSERSIKAIKKHTGQKIPGQKAFFVHTTAPKKEKVKIVHGNVEIARYYQGKKLSKSEYVYFPKRFVFFEDIADYVEDQILKNKLRDGMYVIYEQKHGLIFSSIERDLLPKYFREFFHKYEVEKDERGYSKGFASSILGLKYLGKQHKAAIEWERRATAARHDFRRENEEEKQRLRKFRKQRLKKLSKRSATRKARR